jgi:hypothetical protein
MPSISKSLTSTLDMSKYKPLEPAPPSAPSSFGTAEITQRNAFLRCPVPSISSSATSDDLRQFYQNSRIPQYRSFVGPKK